MMNRLIVIAGPTGVGKTEISLKLAERIGGEIVSCDSMQIYRGMDIGSAKATPEEQARVPHHLLDILSPLESFTVSEYKERAEAIIADIHRRGKVPIMVGGTGLYIDAVIRGYSFTEGGIDEIFRKEMEALAEEKGREAVHELLQQVDLEAAEKIHPNNLKRVIRALEVHRVTGKPFSSFKDQGHLNPKYSIRYVYLNRNREELYQAIDRRVDLMMDAGLLQEVEGLKALGLDESYVSMKGIGYKELLRYLNGNLSLEEARDLIKMLSRNYAKRQLTWFRHAKDIVELNRDVMTEAEILDFLEKP